MRDLQTCTNNYLDYCQFQKRLDKKTLKAYRIDLNQFLTYFSQKLLSEISPDMLEAFIADLHQKYRPKTVKRKIASLKALFRYFECKDLLEQNPFHKIQVRFREPVILPKTIPLRTIETLLSAIYDQLSQAKTLCRQKNIRRDAAVVELLFATGMRISELCSLKPEDISLHDQTVLIYGKGSKERKLQIGNPDVLRLLETYKHDFQKPIQDCGYFFVNHKGRKLSDQSVRRMINKYATLAAIDLHITPHMFRHTFATSLLEADVDIRYIQKMLGHSSIHITEIYTHVDMSKQRSILTTKHPRNRFRLSPMQPM